MLRSLVFLACLTCICARRIQFAGDRLHKSSTGAHQNRSLSENEFSSEDFGQEYDGDELQQPSMNTRPLQALSTALWVASNSAGVETLDKVTQNLKNDIVKLLPLSKEPRWKTFSDSVALLDHRTLNKIEGLQVVKELVKIAMGMRKKFVVKNVQVHFIERHRLHSWWRGGRYRETLDAPLEPFLVAHCSFRLSSKRPMFTMWHNDDPVTIEMTTLFKLDTANKVDYIMIDKLLVNGVEVQSLPHLDLSGNVGANLKKIEDWLQNTKEFQAKHLDSLLRQPLELGELPEKLPALPAGKVSEVVQSNIVRFFQKAKSPNWSLFSEEFKLIDQFGAGILGLGPIKRLFNLLSGLSGRFVTKDLQVQFLEPQRYHSWWERGKEVNYYDEPLTPFIVAKCKVRLTRKGWFAARDDAIPIDLEAETSFHLDSDNKVDKMRIEKWLMNGQSVESWPEIDLSDWQNKNIAKLLEWISEIEGVQLTQALLDQNSEDTDLHLDFYEETMPPLVG